MRGKFCLTSLLSFNDNVTYLADKTSEKTWSLQISRAFNAISYWIPLDSDPPLAQLAAVGLLQPRVQLAVWAPGHTAALRTTCHHPKHTVPFLRGCSTVCTVPSSVNIARVDLLQVHNSAIVLVKTSCGWWLPSLYLSARPLYTEGRWWLLPVQIVTLRSSWKCSLEGRMWLW